MTKAYYYENNGYNGILLANGDRWISISDIIDGIDINRENIPKIVKNLTEADFNSIDFESMWGSHFPNLVYSDETYKVVTTQQVLDEQDTYEEIYRA